MFSPSIFRKLDRAAQVVMLKDSALVSALTGLQSGDVVVDAGSGSGFLAVYLGSIVAPYGKVHSYEWKDDFIELARKNVAKAGLQEVVEVRHEDVLEGISEKNVDLVTLDLAGSEKALGHAHAALKQGGFCVGILPNVEQAKKFVLEGVKLGFKHSQTIDVQERNWLIRDEGCRPETTGVMHTAFLSFLRK